MISFFKNLFQHFASCNTTEKGSSLAYYAVFSLFPMIIIIVSLLGILFGEQAVKGEILTQLQSFIGSEAALQIQDLIKNQHLNHKNILTTVLGFATLALSASGMLIQIYSSFNRIWDVKVENRSGILQYILSHIKSLLVLIILFFIMFSSTALNTFLVKFSEHLHVDYRFAYLYEHLVSLLILSFSFSIMFKFLGDAKIKWGPALAGGLFTAIFFVIGKTGIGFYIGHSHITTTFGTASTIVLLLLWVYYTSQIIFLGASFVYVVSSRLGYSIQAEN